MTPSDLLSTQQGAEHPFGTVRLGDRGRRERVVARAIAHDPSASLPAQMQGKAALQGADRFLQTAAITAEPLIQPQLEQTRAQAGQYRQVLLIQDSTAVDAQQYPTTTGLGPIGNGTHHGFLLQSVLAVRPASPEVLGLAQQEPFLRQPAPAGQTKWQRKLRERVAQVGERSVQAIGAPPAGVQWIPVGDRAGDLFHLLWLCRQPHCDFVVRAAQDRCMDLLVEQADAPRPARSHHTRRPEQPAEAVAAV